jgi:hypothetical protein
MAKIRVFCSSSPESLKNPSYVEVAEQMGELLAQRDHHLVYGGSHCGLMGVVSKAFSNYNGNHNKITEIIPERWEHLIVKKENAIVTENLSERIQTMQDASDGFITLPGGFGSLQETMDVIVARQLKIHQKPLAIVNTGGFYDPFIGQIKRILDYGFAQEDNRAILYIAKNPNQTIEYLETYKPIELLDKLGA